MKLNAFIAIVKGLAADGLGLEDAREQAIAMLDGQDVTNDAGHVIDLEHVKLVDVTQRKNASANGGAASGDANEGDEDDDAVGELRLRAAVKSAVSDAIGKLHTRQGGAVGKRAIVSPEPIVVSGKRFGRLKHFSGKVSGLDADQRAYRFGMWALNAISRSIPALDFAQARAFCQDHGLRTKLHQGGSNASGGYLVPDEFGVDLIELRERFGVFRQNARVRPMSSDTLTEPRRTSGLTAHFVSEGQAGTESTKGWDQIRLTAKDVMVLSRITNQLSEDAVINVGDDLAGEISYAFAEKEDQCGFNGDGGSSFGGIVGLRAKLQDIDGGGTDAAGLVTQDTGNTWGALTLADFDAVVAALPQFADTPNAAWFMHRTFFYSVVEALVNEAGGATPTELREGERRPRPLLKGYPVVFSQVFPSSTATSDVVATLGDLGLAASFGDRRQDTIAFSEHATIGGESVFERNEIAIRGTERFDINVHDVGSSAAAGPMVGLQTGS